MKYKYQLALIILSSVFSSWQIAAQDVGIGTTSPEYKLDVAGRMRLRHEGGGVTAGMWFNKSDNTPYTFAGIRSDTVWGLYESGYKFNFDMKNSRLAIGTVLPQYPLVFAHTLGDKISLYGGGGAANADHYGFGIQSSLMQIFSPTSTSDIAFGYGRSANFTERMRIKGNGDVGIGTASPAYKLDIEDSSSGLFRMTNSSPLALTTQAEMYFKTGSYYTGAIKTIGMGSAVARLGLFTYASSNPANLVERLSITDDGNVGLGITSPTRPLSFPAVLGKKISLYPGATGDVGFSVLGNELRLYGDNPSADITFGYDVLPSSFVERMRIKGNGFVGIGTNAPGYILDVNGRMRIRHNTNSSGIWFANSTNTDDVGFVGMADNNTIGLYGDNGAGFNLVMNTTTGNVGIGSLSPAYKLTVSGNTTSIGWFNNVSTNSGTFGVYASALSGINGSGVAGYGQTGIEGYGIYTGGLVNIGVYGEANSGTTNYAGYFSGNVYTTGVYQSSDRKLKDNITQITNATDIIRNLNPTMYTYKREQYPHMYLPEGLQYGLIADEVMNVIPGAVTKAIQPAQYENHDKQNGRKLNDEVEFNAVNYTAMIPILIAAMKEQQKEIDSLKEEVVEQRKIIQELERK
jgi:hypothetical protein